MPCVGRNNSIREHNEHGVFQCNAIRSNVLTATLGIQQYPLLELPSSHLGTEGASRLRRKEAFPLNLTLSPYGGWTHSLSLCPHESAPL